MTNDLNYTCSEYDQVFITIIKNYYLNKNNSVTFVFFRNNHVF